MVIKRLTLSKLQKCILIVYVIVILWVSVFNVTWIGNMPSSKAKMRINSTIFAQPFKEPTINQPRAIENVYVDINQIVILLFAATVTGGVFFVLSMALTPRS